MGFDIFNIKALCSFWDGINTPGVETLRPRQESHDLLRPTQRQTGGNCAKRGAPRVCTHYIRGPLGCFESVTFYIALRLSEALKLKIGRATINTMQSARYLHVLALVDVGGRWMGWYTINRCTFRKHSLVLHLWGLFAWLA